MSWWKKAKAILFPPQWNARSCTLWWILVSSPLLFFSAFLSGNETLYGVLGTAREVLRNPARFESAFTLTEWLVFITPALALLTAWYAHHYDAKPREDAERGRPAGRFIRAGGNGVKDIILTVPRENRYNLKTEVIAASMTKQSILAAISAALIVLIQPSSGPSLFKYCVRGLATCGFTFAILFLLISMVCYDYASRFNWPGGSIWPDFYRAQLVRKALLLDVFSWYLLLTSFILSVALISPRLSVLTCVASGFLMWWYYFFPPERRGVSGGAADPRGGAEGGVRETSARADAPLRT